MCGLVGIAGDLEFKDEATMKRLLIFDYFRGTDSTGFASVREKNNEVKMRKMASHPIDLFDSAEFKTALSGYTSKAFIGHNRAATIGQVNGSNAHPFHFGNIVGAHNGTLDSESWARLEEAIGHKTNTDSAAIFECIDKIGIEDTIKLMEEGSTSQRGAWALTWFDLKDNTLNFLRNRHRPLWYAYEEGFKKVFWASEYPMIQGAVELSSHGYKLYSDKEGYSFWSCKEDWLYMWDLDELIDGSKNLPKPRIKQIKGREPKKVVAAGGVKPPFQQVGGTNSTTNSRGTTQSATSTDNSILIDIIGSKKEPYGGYLSREDFEDLAKHGCSWCSQSIEYEDVGTTFLEEVDAILCPDCSGNSSDQTRVYADSYNYSQYNNQACM